MLGEIKKVQLRKIWKNEAYDFTPWLSENLERIGEATGLELENPDNRDKVITLTKQFELENKENWNTAINWLTEETLKFKEIFTKMIKEKTAHNNV